MKVYFDSSAYVKIFAQESGSQDARLLFELAHEGRVQIFMSTWTINETIAAIDRKHRRMEISENELKRILATIIKNTIEYSEDSKTITFIPIDREIVDRSQDIIMSRHVSADDALHLYTAYAKDCQYFIHHDEKLKKQIGKKIDDLTLIDVTDHAEINALVKRL